LCSESAREELTKDDFQAVPPEKAADATGLGSEAAIWHAPRY
jgi:hypothetical protein